MHLTKNQKGVSSLGFVIFVLCVIFFIYLGVKLIPVYMQNYQVKSLIVRAAAEARHETFMPLDIFKMNFVNRFQSELNATPIQGIALNDLKIYQYGNNFYIELKYDVVVPFVGNIKFVIHFDDTIEA